MSNQKKDKEKKKEKSLVGYLSELEEILLERYKLTRLEEWRVSYLCIKQGREKVDQANAIEKQIKERRRQLAENAETLEDLNTQHIR